VAPDAAPRAPIRRIVVHVQVGTDRMAATDDPLFLELVGPHGREFRLQPARGGAFRRGSRDVFVLGGKDDPDTNVRNPELNDPRTPAIDASLVQCACVRKGTEPIPNVRGFGEMDDRVQLMDVRVELHLEGDAEPRVYQRQGPFWLGIVCGQRVYLPLHTASGS